jgi:2-dehydropantoate 2-reductase
MSSNLNEPWYIAGAGSIGLLIYQQLSQHQNCLLINRDVNEGKSSISFNSLSGATSRLQLNWFTPSTESEQISKVIITTKSHQVESCIAGLVPYLSENAQIVLLHNGLGAQQRVISRWPEYNFFVATTTSGAWRDHDSLTHAGLGETLIGRLETHDKAPDNITMLCHLLPNTQWSEDITTALHLKVAINASINPLTALYECRNGELLDENTRQRQLTELSNETQAVLNSYDIPVSDLLKKVLEVAHNTGNNFSSTYQDWKHGRKTELANMNGYIQQLAKEAGLKVPEHDKVMAILKDKVLL